MTSNCISADSSFYICFSNDINRRDLLDKVVVAYRFFIGERIESELPLALRNDTVFMLKLTRSDYDYFELVRPFFGRASRHKTDGEYEAIGIGYSLAEDGQLLYLIVDDRRARTFVKTHFPGLSVLMVGTLGFIRDSCCRDGVVFPPEAISILNGIKATASRGVKKRPCGIEAAKYNEILDPIVNQIRKMAGL